MLLLDFNQHRMTTSLCSLIIRLGHRISNALWVAKLHWINISSWQTFLSSGVEKVVGCFNASSCKKFVIFPRIIYFVLDDVKEITSRSTFKLKYLSDTAIFMAKVGDIETRVFRVNFKASANGESFNDVNSVWELKDISWTLTSNRVEGRSLGAWMTWYQNEVQGSLK